MDIASLVGIVGCWVLVVGAMLMGGTLGMYWDAPSLIIVLAGASFGVMARWPMPLFISGMTGAGKAMTGSNPDPKEIIDQVCELADVARKGSILALEKVTVEEPFLAKNVKFMVDGYDPKVIDDLIELEMDNMEERHKNGRSVMDNMADACPAFGMIGTVVGLIVIMANLSDPDAIGPGLAVALITTLYGSMFSNMIFIPIGQKLKYRSQEELLNMSIIQAGVSSITKGENPRAIREKLESFLAAKDRSADEG